MSTARGLNTRPLEYITYRAYTSDGRLGRASGARPPFPGEGKGLMTRGGLTNPPNAPPRCTKTKLQLMGKKRCTNAFGGMPCVNGSINIWCAE